MDTDIRQASREDAEVIVACLKAEIGEGETGFWHNRGLIRDGAAQGNLSALIADSKIAGFLLHSDSSLDIMEIWGEFRRRGLGRKLAEYGLKRIDEAGSLGVEIECAPETSASFWKKVGFQPVSVSGEGPWLWHGFPKRFALPVNAIRKHLSFELTIDRTEDRRTIHREGAVVGDIVHLDERIAERVDHDTFVRVTVDAEEVYDDKAKYRGAEAMGIQLQHQFLRIDDLQLCAFP